MPFVKVFKHSHTKKDVLNREGDGTRSVHIINIEIKDNHTEAALGGKIILRLASLLQQSQDVDGEISTILSQLESETSARILHAVSFY